mmetsp:Transcript_33788/g.97419  ORF Transcript_33788/g.97419 Transcript_33788/m.97419 type:complete len:304 (+) Transcript_33788:599-1510(+)
MVDDHLHDEGAHRHLSALTWACRPAAAVLGFFVEGDGKLDGRVIVLDVLLEGVLLQGVHGSGGQGRVEGDGELGLVADGADLVGGVVTEELEGAVLLAIGTTEVHVPTDDHPLGCHTGHRQIGRLGVVLLQVYSVDGDGQLAVATLARHPQSIAHLSPAAALLHQPQCLHHAAAAQLRRKPHHARQTRLVDGVGQPTAEGISDVPLEESSSRPEAADTRQVCGCLQTSHGVGREVLQLGLTRTVQRTTDKRANHSRVSCDGFIDRCVSARLREGGRLDEGLERGLQLGVLSQRSYHVERTIVR